LPILQVSSRHSSGAFALVVRRHVSRQKLAHKRVSQAGGKITQGADQGVGGGKAVSDTPRTDKVERTADTLNVMDAFEFAIYHGQKLEIELNEAMQRIKELEEDK